MKTINKPLIFNIIYFLLAIVLAIAGVFGYNNFTPDPQVAAVVQLAVVLVPLVINLFTHQQAAVRETALKEEVTQARDLATARSLNDPALPPRL